MPFSYNEYTADGVQTQFIINKPYISQSHIKVYFNGLEANFNWINDSTVEPVNTPINGTKVRVARETPTTNRFVDYQNGASFNEATLDLDANQLLYIMQESLDQAVNNMVRDVASNTINAMGGVIRDVANPIEDQDAATKAWVLANLESEFNAVFALKMETKGYRDETLGYRDEANQWVQDFRNMNYVADIATGEPEAAYDPVTNTLHLYLQQGPAGPQGIQGPQGVMGPQGDIGPEGRIGDVGPAGPQGPMGPAGPTGARGPEGLQGNTGAAGPMGAQGIQGERGLQGPEGAVGPVGPQGAIGQTGAQGPIGPQGVQGIEGPVGPQGIQGPKGDKGDKGDTGDQGPVGPDGAIGPQGPMGVSPLELAFGRFMIDENGMLVMEYVGNITEGTFELQPDGTIIVNT